ncbi:MAG TPA: IclR family transcriptional regulator [Magnetospirillaceae bacterium]|nr:IclR family transcriptional regulator [Magnetospirillaceae bacterium]
MDKTLLKGLQVLEALAHSTRSRGVSDLAKELDLTRSNMHRTLRTLVESGLVRQEESGAYACTLKLFELGSAVPARSDVAGLADPIMLALADATNETVHLSALEGGDVIYLHKIDSTHPVRAYTTVGGRAPAYCVATGKALLAFQPDSYLDRYEDALQRFTPKTLADLESLRAELREVRRQGFALNRGEWRDSVCGVAAPVFGVGGRAVAAIGLSGPASRLGERLDDFAGQITAAARELTQKMGCRLSASN